MAEGAKARLCSNRLEEKPKYKGIMTFNTAEKILSSSDEDYEPPEFPFEVPSFVSPVSFGKEMRKHFLLDFDNWTFINHGAFGCVLRESLETAYKWQCYIERQPVRFIDRELLAFLAHVNRRLASFVGSDPTDIVLLPNATTATNTVMKSIAWRPGDIVYFLNTCYYTVKKLLRHLSQECGVILKEVTITFPANNQEILEKIKETLDEGTRLALFSHIPSNYPVVMPVEEMVKLCHNKGVPVLIDGAHALGSLPLDLRTLKADYYVSNAHKWLSCPKGCAFLHVSKEHQSMIQPLVVSSGFSAGFNSQFIWTGLKDYSPYLSLNTVLDFWETMKPERIRKHNNTLANQAALMLAEKWGTSLLSHAEMFGPMVLIRLPDALLDCVSLQGQEEAVKAHAEMIQAKLHYEFNIEVPVKLIQGKLYTRISAHVYNEISDYSRLGDVIAIMTNEAQNNSMAYETYVRYK
ncbi:uncharacterized protein [Montipora foliosa]|uniref:uncharacterized protein n=1 Tax=Montipora foliosa TaxID=591990 RepID=UPI0035F183CA